MSVKTSAHTVHGTTRPATASKPTINRPSSIRSARVPAKRDHGDYHPACVAIIAVVMLGAGIVVWSQNETNVAIAKQHRLELSQEADRRQVQADKRRIADFADRLASFPPAGG